MLAIENKTPYAAERTLVMDKHGAKSWVVVVKATFVVQPDGTTQLAAEQKKPLYSPAYLGEPGKSSLVYEADMVPAKSTTDILLNGHAYVPGGRQASVVDVSMRVGPWRKQLRVFGDRRWERGLLWRYAKTSPEAFNKMPITYERAFGGWDRSSNNPAAHRLYSNNPIGTGFVTQSDHLEGVPLPNVEDPHHLVADWDDRPRPGGFGAIASYWTPRLEHAGTYDARWKEKKFPLLPDDFDDRFYQSAPEDQQASRFLRGGEEVVLENLCESGLLGFGLPKVYLAFTTWFGKQSQDHRASLQTVLIEPDERQVILVWQTSLACHHLIEKLDKTTIKEKRYL